MATYQYKLRTPEGKLEKGTLQGGSQSDALLKVKKLDGILISLEEVKESTSFAAGFFRGKISLKDRIILTEQLAVMLNAGITLVQALRSLEEESSNKALKHVLSHLVTDVQGGVQFSYALEKHPKVFSNIFIQMVRSAEKTGNLAEILNKLTVQQQKEYELRGKVRGALMYPAIVSILMIGVIVLVITFILPKLTGMFVDSGQDLPASTRFLMALSSLMTHQWYLFIIAIGGLTVGAKLLVRNPRGRLLWDTFKLRIPVLGSFMKKSCMARFSQSFGSLAQAGVPVLEVFQTVKGVVGNSLYEQEIEKISKDVANGIKVSVAIRKSKHFPAMIGQLVAVGEQSGDLAGIFKVLGDFFEKEVDGMAKNLSTLLEPVIMIVMGVVIGFILVSVLQPIYGLVNAV
ncbi:MAG TPA: type II secretion system F family protein [Verrucomicrobiae bacterium]|nr:type II secretion system F family protein [Verrucomicrobiae bacterium]